MEKRVSLIFYAKLEEVTESDNNNATNSEIKDTTKQ